MTDQSVDRVLAGLNDEQLAAVTTPADVLCIRAGAGSGKTRVLTRRIAYGAATDALDPRRVLALTFTRKAAGELNHRLRQLGLRQSAAAGTFHAIALAQLRQRWEERDERPPTLLERKVGFVARMLPRTSDRTTPLDIVGEIEWAKARRITPERYAAEAAAADRHPPLEPQTLARIFAEYEDAKTDRRLIDFDDILILCGRALQRDRSAAEAFRWKFRNIFVDEFQDVNPLQFALLKVFVGDDPRLCVVGDSRQAIYAWNGADSSYLDEFDRHFPGSEQVSLHQNYRSTPEILKCASAVLPDHPALIPTRGRGSAPTIESHATAEAEAKAITRALRNANTSTRHWSDMAVLARTNAQVVLLANACTEAGVPVNARTDAKLLDRPEIQDAIDDLEKAGPNLSPALDDLSQRMTAGHDLARDEIEDEEGSDDRRSIVESFIRLGRDHLAVDPNATVKSFVEALKAGTNESTAFNADAVDLTTFHAAKGLEWDVVHISGMERGLSPIGHAKTPDAIAEEHRLVYVALTRARESLQLHWAQERRFGDRVSTRSPSPLLDDIAAAARGEDPRARRSASAKKARSERKKVKTSKGRAAVDLVDDADPVLVALKSWRSSIAKANGVPAFVVFHDSTLHAIAHSRPHTENGLASLPGIGPVKIARYGEDLLRVVESSS